MASQNRAEGLSTVPKHKKDVMCLGEKTCMLDKLCSAIQECWHFFIRVNKEIYSAVGCELNVSEPTM